MGNLHRQDVSWAVRRLPREVRKLLQDHPEKVFLAGGYIRSRVSGEPVNDVDLFTGSAELGRELASELVGGDAKRLHVTDNAITVRALRGPAVQFITRWTFDTPEQCVASFDFTIASAAIWYDGERWRSTCHPDFYADLAAKRLTYLRPDREEEPGGSMLRVLKFYQRGYRIPLDSLGAIIARLVRGVDFERLPGENGQPIESRLAKVLTALLVEVDPSLDPEHNAHLPSEDKPEEASDEMPF